MSKIEPRIEALEWDALAGLGSGDIISNQQLLDLNLPSQLSLEEVKQLGGRVAIAIELDSGIPAPTWDDYYDRSRIGKRAREKAIFNIGLVSLTSGDLITFDSTIITLRKDWSVKSQMDALTLWRNKQRAMHEAFK
jgi:hypothetical protein